MCAITPMGKSEKYAVDTRAQAEEIMRKEDKQKILEENLKSSSKHLKIDLLENSD